MKKAKEDKVSEEEMNQILSTAPPVIFGTGVSSLNFISGWFGKYALHKGHYQCFSPYKLTNVDDYRQMFKFVFINPKKAKRRIRMKKEQKAEEEKANEILTIKAIAAMSSEEYSKVR